MLDINNLIQGFDVADARSAIYYASRYIKQAQRFNEYGKDIFEEEARSAPSEVVRRLSLDIVAAIEAHEGVKAADLGHERIFSLLNHLTSLERTLGLDFSEDELAAAARFAASISPPSTTE